MRKPERISEYEPITKQLGKINKRKGPGLGTGFFTMLGEAGLFAYGIKEIYVHPGFWVIVWKIAQVTLGGRKEGKTTVWQRVDRDD